MAPEPAQSATELRRLAFSPTDEERFAGALETSEKLDHTLRAYGRMERRLYETRRERDSYREALRIIRDNCQDWSNDDIRDQCGAALDQLRASEEDR